MDQTIGRVIDIYIPNQYKNGKLLDVMDRSKITFKVVTEKKLEEIEVEQNLENVKIMKNDLVEIRKYIVLDKVYIDIKLYRG